MSFVAEPVEGIAILLWSAAPETPALLATPFFHAAAAAAMDVPVEMYFSARSVHLLVPGVAQALRAAAHVDKTIWDNMLEAAALGVTFYACTDALHAQGLQRQQLISQCAGHGGAVQFMARAADRRWKTLVF